MSDESHCLLKCQFSAAGDRVAAVAGEAYSNLENNCKNIPEGGEPGWGRERIRKAREGGAESRKDRSGEDKSVNKSLKKD